MVVERRFPTNSPSPPGPGCSWGKEVIDIMIPGRNDSERGRCLRLRDGDIEKDETSDTVGETDQTDGA